MSKVKHSASFEIDQPVAELFPLFSAEGEKSWVPGWEYENIMGGTVLYEGYVFLTKNHDHAAADAVWIVKKYDPDDYLVQFYKIEPNEKIGVIEVKCFQLDKTRTKVQVAYEYIGLSRKGSDFIANFTQSGYDGYIAEWKIYLSRISMQRDENLLRTGTGTRPLLFF